MMRDGITGIQHHYQFITVRVANHRCDLPSVVRKTEGEDSARSSVPHCRICSKVPELSECHSVRSTCENQEYEKSKRFGIRNSRHCLSWRSDLFATPE